MLLGVPSKCHAIQSGAIHMLERGDDLLRYAKSFAQYSRLPLTIRFKTRYSFCGLDKELRGFRSLQVPPRRLPSWLPTRRVPSDGKDAVANFLKASVDLISNILSAIRALFHKLTAELPEGIGRC